jgi:hypothetical protein
MPTKTKEPEVKPEIKEPNRTPEINPDRVLSPEKLCPGQKKEIERVVRDI